MRKITQEKLNKKLSLHNMWLNREKGGERLVLVDYDLSDSDLSDSDLSDSDLSGSNLSDSDLRGSNLSGSNLSGSNLRGSNLSGSNLRGSNLSGSNLSDSNLSGSNLDFSCLPLWCGGQFRADDRICKQLVAHVVRIMELSEIDQPELIEAMNKYKAGWHRESKF